MFYIENKYARQAVTNYGVVLGLCLCVYLLSRLQEIPSDLLFLKVLATPAMWLALQGPDALFRSPVYEGRFTFRALEYSLILGFVFSLFTVFLSLSPGINLQRVLSGFFVMFPVLGVALLIMGIRRTAA